MLVYNKKSILATCCDKDGICFGDGTDDWCCGGKFYCSNNSPIYAVNKGGILCPASPRKDVAFAMNIAGISLMVLLVMIFALRFRKKSASVSYVSKEDEVIQHDHEELPQNSTVNETEMFDPFQDRQK